MKAVFKELSAFEAIRSEYLTDDQYREFQNMLLANPKMGDVIAGSGGLRKCDLLTRDARKASEAA